jgi:hypothetical protein
MLNSFQWNKESEVPLGIELGGIVVMKSETKTRSAEVSGMGSLRWLVLLKVGRRVCQKADLIVEHSRSAEESLFVKQ